MSVVNAVPYILLTLWIFQSIVWSRIRSDSIEYLINGLYENVPFAYLEHSSYEMEEEQTMFDDFEEILSELGEYISHTRDWRRQRRRRWIYLKNLCWSQLTKNKMQVHSLCETHQFSLELWKIIVYLYDHETSAFLVNISEFPQLILR